MANYSKPPDNNHYPVQVFKGTTGYRIIYLSDEYYCSTFEDAIRALDSLFDESIKTVGAAVEKN